jgi:hypothetical protein
VRENRIEPRFVEFVPEVLEQGIVYISIEYGAVVHACCCGCGEKVSTPLSPAQWSVTYDGEHITLSPSVGSGRLPCNSHYLITRNEVRWAPTMTKAQTAAALTRDRAGVTEHLEHTAPPKPRRRGWRSRIAGWFRR